MPGRRMVDQRRAFRRCRHEMDENMKKYRINHWRNGRTFFFAALLCSLAVFLGAGCAAVGPDYEPVALSVAPGWHTDLRGGLTSGCMLPEVLADWWRVFDDALLTRLEARAVSGNLGLKEARSRVLEARAQRGVRDADRFPTLDLSGTASQSRTSENGTTGRAVEDRLYAAGFDAGWELDVFGGVRRSVEAAQADLDAAEEAYRDVLVSLMAETALNYIEVRTYQARLAAARANMVSQEETYRLNRSRFEAGIINELAVQQSRYVLEQTRASIPSLEIGLEAAKNRLAVLVGESPGAVHDMLNAPVAIPVLPPSCLVCLPADTLRSRPDVRRAERLLAAQTARVGVATADLYPRFRLFGALGLESLASDDFFSAASRTWQVGPSLSWRVFSAGAIRQNIAIQSARQEQAMIQYEATVLGALEEVENVLVAYSREQNRHQALRAAVAAARKADLLARDQFEAGLVDFSNVLDAQRQLLVLEDTLAQNEGVLVSNLVKLYKAFGGGWQASVIPGVAEKTE